MNIKTRIWILSVIDALFVVGLGVLLVWGGGEESVAIVAGIALIAYVSWSIVRLRRRSAP
ncbi:MAG TPA: hypothetical protein VLT91_00395 [Rhizomicrobium sp.]|nr:hypothetical protein [Rhizomicrobium sp.]